MSPPAARPRRPVTPPRRIRDTHLRSAHGSGRGRVDPAVVVSALVMIGLAVAVMVGLLTN